MCICVLSHSVLSDCLQPHLLACQAPLSMGILQTRIVEWVTMPSSRRSSQPRDWAQVSRIADGFFTIWATREALCVCVCVCDFSVLLWASVANLYHLILQFWFSFNVFHEYQFHGTVFPEAVVYQGVREGRGNSQPARSNILPLSIVIIESRPLLAGLITALPFFPFIAIPKAD